MTLVALGLLLGMAGLLWVVVIDVTRADHHRQRQSPREQDEPLAEATRWESRAV